MNPSTHQSASIDDGQGQGASDPYAFPLGDPTHGGYDGMKLRDWFAGQALAGMLAGGWKVIEDGRPLSARECASSLADSSYAVADAMLAERERKS